MSKRLPDFLIAGVARCGTTSLFYYLKQHPDIGFPSVKEPKYFSSQHIHFPQKGIGDASVDEKMITELEEYQQLFHSLGNVKITGEASSDYFYYHKAIIQDIKKALGDIPIIISIRNPVDRAFSAYNNLIRDGRENAPFSEAIKKEKKRIIGGWDWMWHYKQGSLYSEGIKAFQDHFSNVKIILFEDFKNPTQLLHDLTDFLGVERYHQYDTGIKYSPSGEAKNPLVKILSSRRLPVIRNFRNSLLNILGRDRAEKLAKNLFEKDELSMRLKNELQDYFKEDINRTELLIDRDLTHWKS